MIILYVIYVGIIINNCIICFTAKNIIFEYLWAMEMIGNN